MRKMKDVDLFGSLLGQRLQSTYSGDEKEKSTVSDIFSRKTQEAIEERFANLKKMLDEDPYGVLFGRRLQTKSPEDATLCDAINFRPSTREGISSVNNARDLNKSKFGSNGPRPNAASRSNGEPPLQNAATESVSESESQNEDLEFDPITMRRVAKKRSNMTVTFSELDTDKSFSIPVKPFKGPIPSNPNSAARATKPDTQTSSQPPSSRSKTPTTTSTLNDPGRGWLAQEGFDAERHEVDKSRPSLSNDTSNESNKASIHKIESALDRHIKAMNMSSDQNLGDSSSLKYPIRENTEEDVDLLRSSDVRASAGICRRVAKPTTAEKQERRSILSRDYERRKNQLDRQLEEELASQRAALKNTKIRAEVVDSSPKSSNKPGRHLSEVTSSSQSEARKQIEARRAHESEVNAQKVAMEAIETRDKLGSSQRNIESVRSQGAGESCKAKNINMFAGRTSLKSDQQLAKDEALIHDIRSIYEDRYGTIDTNHRQPSIDVAEIKPIKSELGNPQSLRKATKETLEQSTKAVDGEKRAGDHQRPLHTSGSVPITTEQPANSGDPSCVNSPDHKMGDQSDTRRQILREVYETQNLIRDLSRRISESYLPQSLLTESLSRPNVPDSALQQSPNSLSIPYQGQRGLNGADETMSDKQAKVHPSSKPAVSHSDSKLPSSDGSEAGETVSIPVSYRILAYDPTTQRVTVAKNTFLTSPTSEKRLTVAEALSGLTNPAKFLPHFASLQNAGYEIVSGSSNLLIFQKTGSEKPLETSTDEHVPEFKDRYSMPTNPIDGTTPQTGNFASPTGFVNYDSILPTPGSEEGTTWQNYSRAPKPNDKVRQEEPVFSGGWRASRDEKSGKWVKFRERQRRRRRWRRTKRMVWVGSCLAGCCYVAAVASEVFRGRTPRKPSALPDRVQ